MAARPLRISDPRPPLAVRSPSPAGSARLVPGLTMMMKSNYLTVPWRRRTVGERRNKRGRTGVANAALRRALSALLLALTLGTAFSGVAGAAPDFADDAFANVWTRTDAPVQSTSVARSWFWGPQANSGPLYERYLDAPNQERLVQYFDKGRMEINDPAGDRADPWFVTSGLLDRELISGQIGRAHV